jgi:hypothetical protein
MEFRFHNKHWIGRGAIDDRTIKHVVHTPRCHCVLERYMMLCFPMTIQARQLWYRVWRDHYAGVGVLGRARPGVSIQRCR